MDQGDQGSRTTHGAFLGSRPRSKIALCAQPGRGARGRAGSAGRRTGRNGAGGDELRVGALMTVAHGAPMGTGTVTQQQVNCSIHGSVNVRE